MQVLLLESQSTIALNVARCLSECPDTPVHLFARNRRTGARLSRFIHRFFDCTPLGEYGLLAKLNGFAAAHPDTLLLPVDVASIAIVARHREALRGFASIARVPSSACIEMAVDKWATAEQLGKLEIACPETLLYRPGEAFEQQLSQFTGPCLIKPRVGEFGQGIRKFDNAAQLLLYWRQAARDEAERWVVQQFLPGQDIDCSVLCREGRILAYTIQTPSDRMRREFKATMNVRFCEDSTVLALVERMMAQLGWNGIAHIDLRYDERNGQLYVLEINPRYWGSLMASLYAGVNFPKLAMLEALGREFPLPRFKQYEYFGNLHPLKNLLRSGWRCSGLTYLLRDPLPETAKLFTRICKT